MSKLSYYFEMSRKMHPVAAAPKVVNYFKYKALPKKVITRCTRYSPQIAALLLTMRCNLKCGYCNASKMLAQAKENNQDTEATLEKVRKIMENPLFSRALLVDLLGGEPLLVKDLGRIVQYLSQRGHLINTATNGILLASRIKELKTAGITRINVSLYDASRETLRKDLPYINSIFPVHASLVLLRSEVENNPHKIFETVKFAQDTRCRSLRFWMYRPMGLNPDQNEIITDINPAYRDLKRKIEETAPGFCLWPNPVKSGTLEKACSQLWQRVNCDMAGNMYICCGTEDPLGGESSNLFSAGADVVFNHPVFTGMRNKLLDADSAPPKICRNCNLLGEPGW
jgi:organic radical activating enzyme